MSAKTGSKIPLVIGAGLLAVGAVYVASTVTKVGEDERQVTYSATWKPTNVRALVVEFGIHGSPETREKVPTPFSQTRVVSRKEIVILDIQMPFQRDEHEGGCQIKVGDEAPKTAVFRDGRCYVEKYVP